VTPRPSQHDAYIGAITDHEANSLQKYFRDGAIDDARIYNRALTEHEIQQVMIGIPPGVASDPNPADKATDVPREVVLSWTPGEYVPATNGHKVYLSENFDDVNDRIGGIAHDADSYAPPQHLDFGTTYYWRVDEVNGAPDHTVYEGNIWSLTTEPVGYPIENITVTASSTHSPNMSPENTVNGSGLDANDLHSVEGTDMWLSSSEPHGHGFNMSSTRFTNCTRCGYGTLIKWLSLLSVSGSKMLRSSIRLTAPTIRH